MAYVVKCDECKRDMRETEDAQESYAGGTCDECRKVITTYTDLIARCHGSRTPAALQRQLAAARKAYHSRCSVA